MDISSLLLGLAIGVIGAFGTGFLKRAGEDLYSWSKRKIDPKSATDQTPQVVVHLRNDSGNQHTELTQTNRLTPAAVERLNLIGFTDIETAIGKAPPMQREDVANRFAGLKIEWDSYLRSARKRPNGNVFLILSIDKDYRGRSVICEVPADQYRELGILPEGAHIRVSGEIAKASPWDVEVMNAQLQILPNSAVT